MKYPALAAWRGMFSRIRASMPWIALERSWRGVYFFKAVPPSGKCGPAEQGRGFPPAGKLTARRGLRLGTALGGKIRAIAAPFPGIRWMRLPFGGALRRVPSCFTRRGPDSGNLAGGGQNPLLRRTERRPAGKAWNGIRKKPHGAAAFSRASEGSDRETMPAKP